MSMWPGESLSTKHITDILGGIDIVIRGSSIMGEPFLHGLKPDVSLRSLGHLSGIYFPPEVLKRMRPPRAML